MFIEVRLLNGFKRTLTYRVPADQEQHDLIGQIVLVPLRKRLVHALVLQQTSELVEQPEFVIKDVHAVQVAPLDERYENFAHTLAQYYHIDVTYILRRLHGLLTSQSIQDVLVSPVAYALCCDTCLTLDQERVYQHIVGDIGANVFSPTLLHGVTGSGKTEIYKKLIMRALELQKTVIFMVPEVTLAVQFQNLFRSAMPTYASAIFGFHSATSAKEKRTLWRALLAQQPLLLIGVHLPVLLPINNLGLIIVDEEHESGYQEKSHPKINSKHAALMRAQQYKIPIVLGSATPSVQSLHATRTHGWRFCQLTQRFAGSFAQVHVVQLSSQVYRNFWISRELDKALTACLARNEQALIFINRRGLSFFMQCKQCAHVIMCPRCSVSLTVHEGQQLCCHYCGYRRQVPTECQNCKNKKFNQRGIGTQQMVKILEKLFPSARIARADLDVTVNKKNWQATLQNFQDGELDILVGTQTITKGYHFPRVTLVGIVWADLNLHFPSYHASETTLQQLIQVAGRAGRDPPYGRFAEIEVLHRNEIIAERDAQKLAQTLRHMQQAQPERYAQLTILGPALPSVQKLKNIYRRKVYLKAPTFALIYQVLTALKHIHLQSTWYFNPDSL